MRKIILAFLQLTLERSKATKEISKKQLYLLVVCLECMLLRRKDGCMDETNCQSVKQKKRELNWFTSEAPLPFQQGLIWRTSLRSPGHRCLLSTWLLPVSHRGCAETWPTHDTLQPQVIHTWNRGRQLCSLGETQKTEWQGKAVNGVDEQVVGNT